MHADGTAQDPCNPAAEAVYGVTLATPRTPLVRDWLVGGPSRVSNPLTVMEVVACSFHPGC